MTYRLPPLTWLRTFEAAARHSNFAAAARELNMTQPAVSYQVRALEQSLSAPLFERHARRVELTDLGLAYLPSVRRAFSQLSASTAGLFGVSGQRELTVRCTASFATLWLAPRLHRFQAAHPNIKIRLLTSTWTEAAESESFDVDIRYGYGPATQTAVALSRCERSVMVCSPELTTMLGDPPQAAACASQNLIHILGCESFWDHWFSIAGLADIPSRRDIKVDSSIVALEVAASGFGVALVFEIFARSFLENGRLVAPFAHTFESEQAHYLVLPERETPDSPEALMFRDWVLEEAGLGTA